MKIHRSRRGTSPLVALRIALALFAIALPACAPSSSAPPQAATLGMLQPWEGSNRNLFDDSIDPSAVGLTDPIRAARDPLLAARAHRAEFVLRMRVQTVTADGRGHDTRYQVTLRTVGDPLLGPRPPTNDITLTITRASPGFGIAKAMDLRLSGRTVVALLRRFNQSGQETVHWHLTADADEVHQALQNTRFVAGTTD